MVDELSELKETYELSDEEAISVIKSVSRRMLDELLNLALRASMRFEEEMCVKYTKEFLRYFLFLADDTQATYQANARLFQQTDLIRLVQFYGTYIENQKIEESDNEEVIKKLTEEAELLNQLKSQIYLTEDYNAPARGMKGLLGTYKTRKEIEEEQSRKIQKRLA